MACLYLHHTNAAYAGSTHRRMIHLNKSVYLASILFCICISLAWLCEDNEPKLVSARLVDHSGETEKSFRTQDKRAALDWNSLSWWRWLGYWWVKESWRKEVQMSHYSISFQSPLLWFGQGDGQILLIQSVCKYQELISNWIWSHPQMIFQVCYHMNADCFVKNRFPGTNGEVVGIWEAEPSWRK